MKYSFSGHESFSCKQYWLKKGIDYVKNNSRFTDDNAVVELGVGKNMVTAIRFWLKAFGMVDENDQSSEIAEFLFGEGGVDPFLEDTNSLWLLHYHLVKEKRSNIYDLVFNHFRYEKSSFSKDQLIKFLNRKIEENKDSFSPKTIETDVRVLFGNYISSGKTDIEEGYSGVLQELQLLSKTKIEDFENKKMDWFSFHISEKDDLAKEVLLYSILDNHNYGQTISFRELISSPDSPGSIFLLNEVGLRDKIQYLTEQNKSVVFTETAGNQILQIKRPIDKWEILRDYYKAND